MFSLKKLLSTVSRRTARRNGFQIEALEQRQLMTVSMTLSVTGVLSVRGDDTPDKVTVLKSGNNTLVQSVTAAGVATTANMGANVTALEIRTYGGNDIVNNNTNLQATVWGGLGDDVLNGGSGRDYLYGGDGNDTLRGNANSDALWGGGGNDTLYGNAGADSLYGESGNDVIFGGGGSDYISGSTGDDSLYGDDWLSAAIVDAEAAGKDTVYGGDGNDTLYGGANDDRLAGGTGIDYLYGQDGNDRLFGDLGIDTLFGQNGNDFLDAGSANEFTNGGDGYDFNAFTTVVNGATNSDIAQGNSNNCFILSSMGTAATRGVNMASRITYAGNGLYNVALFQRSSTGTYTPTTVSVFFDGTLNSTDPTAHFRGQEGESWTIIMNRALAQLLNVNLNTTGGGYAGDVLAAITGRAPHTTSWIDNSGIVSPWFRDPILDYLFAVGNAAPTIVGTRNTDAQMGSNLFASNHVYMVQSVIITGYVYSTVTFQMIPQYSIVLYNPWGTDNTASRIANGTGRAYGDNNDGLLVISGTEFKRNFDEITFA